MGKLVAALMLVFIIEIALAMFSTGGLLEPNCARTDPPTCTVVTGFLIDPSSASTTGFYILMVAVLSIAGIAVIIPGSFYQANQWALFAVAAAGLITMVGSITHLWGFLNSELLPMFRGNPQLGALIASLITAPLLIFYIVSVIEWSRQN